MRKIPPELENPFDNIFIYLAEYLSPYFKQLHFTPNDLTSISFITGLYSVFLYAKKRYLLCVIFFITSYIFDCFDGYYARKYNMYTKFGDYYDPITDYIVSTPMLLLISNKYLRLGNNNPKKYLPLLFILSSILVLIHLGCQEEYYSSKKSYFIPSRFCPKKSKHDVVNFMRVSRFFGCGTMIVIICIAILLSSSVDSDIYLSVSK